MLEKDMTPHSSTLAWKTLWTEEPGGLQSLGLGAGDFTRPCMGIPGDKMGSLGERRAPGRGTRMPFEEHDDEVRAETV